MRGDGGAVPPRARGSRGAAEHVRFVGRAARRVGDRCVERRGRGVVRGGTTRRGCCRSRCATRRRAPSSRGSSRGWGLASMAFAATAAEPARTRLVAHACLAALSDALEDANAPRSASAGQLVALLRVPQRDAAGVRGRRRRRRGRGRPRGVAAGERSAGAVPVSDRRRRVRRRGGARGAPPRVRDVPEPDEGGDAPRRAGHGRSPAGVPRRASTAATRADAGFGAESKSSADPVASSTGGSGGRAGVRAPRAHVLRLLLASLRGQADDARLFRQVFRLRGADVAPRERDGRRRDGAAVSAATVARCAATPAAARPLVESGGLVPWLAGVARSACAPTMTHARESLASRAHAARTALGAPRTSRRRAAPCTAGPRERRRSFCTLVGGARAALAPIMDVDEERKRPRDNRGVPRGARARDPAARRRRADPAATRGRGWRDVAETGDVVPRASNARAREPRSRRALARPRSSSCATPRGPRGGPECSPWAGRPRRALAAEGAAATAACARWGSARRRRTAVRARPPRASSRGARARARGRGRARRRARRAPRRRWGGGVGERSRRVADAADEAARAAEAAAVAAQAALLRATLRAAAAAAARKKGSSGSRGPAVAPGDEAAVAAAATPAYGALLAAGGALDELVAAAEAAEAEAEAEAEKEANEKETSPRRRGEKGTRDRGRDVAKRRARRVAAELRRRRRARGRGRDGGGARGDAPPRGLRGRPRTPSFNTCGETRPAWRVPAGCSSSSEEEERFTRGRTDGTEGRARGSRSGRAGPRRRRRGSARASSCDAREASDT